jgi:hypothetical protein
MTQVTIVALVVVCGLALQAQAPTLPADRFGWDQVASSLLEAQGLRYTVYLDGGAGSVLAATCSGPASPFSCAAPLPPVTPGTHAAQLTAAFVLVDGRLAESERSAAFNFRVFVAPAAPSGLRIVPSP